MPEHRTARKPVKDKKSKPDDNDTPAFVSCKQQTFKLVLEVSDVVLSDMLHTKTKEIRIVRIKHFRSEKDGIQCSVMTPKDAGGFGAIKIGQQIMKLINGEVPK